jgi:predicted alpha/beta superfamily hydrolase
MPENRVKKPYIDGFMPHIQLLSEAFAIPQLKKKRRIWALLPHDYHSSDQSYPVLYLQDAQNLFDESAPFGNWAIDRRLAALSSRGMGGIIVIAVDHGGTERITEYSPYHHRKFGKGQGRKYAQFLIETLKPHVDKTFRTKTARAHTGIGGSSMGGLISAYTGVVHPQHFSRLMIFSPSFWYSDEIYFDAFSYKYILPMKIYLYAGENESRYMTEHIHRFREAVKSSVFESPLTKFRIEINQEGEHNEWYWGEAFEAAVPWLFFE